MHEITLTPAATVGLFIAHRQQKPDSIENINASLDADRWFTGKDPIVKTTHFDADGAVTIDPKKAKTSSIDATHAGERKVRCEDPIYNHLKAALKAAIEKKSFNYDTGSPSPMMGSEAHNALEKAVKVEVAKEAPAVAPKLVEKPSKKTG